MEELFCVYYWSFIYYMGALMEHIDSQRNKVSSEEKIANDIKNIKTNSWQDHFKNILISLVAAAPYVGGPISILLDKYIPERRQKRIVEFYDDLFDEMKKLDKKKINQEYLKSEEFGYLIEETTECVSKAYQKEKIKAYKNILINSLTDTQTNQDVKEIYLHLVDELTDYDIEVLKHIYRGYEIKFESGFCKERARQEDKSEMRNAMFDLFRHVYDKNNYDWKIDLYSVILHLVSKKLLSENDLVYEHFKKIKDSDLESEPSILSGTFSYNVQEYMTSLSYGFVEFIIGNND